MSTKCTLARGEDFHFYQEVLDADHVYLSLDTFQYAVWDGRVLVSIPIHIWETIRHLGGARFDLVDKTDAELRAMAAADVDRRIGEFAEAQRASPAEADSVRRVGGILYGAADTPRDEQIERGLEYFHKERQRQKRVKGSVAGLRAKG